MVCEGTSTDVTCKQEDDNGVDWNGYTIGEYQCINRVSTDKPQSEHRLSQSERRLPQSESSDGPNPEAKDSNPNHFILLESESESKSTQVCNGFES